MPNWNNQPPKDANRSGYRLIRTPTSRPLVGHVINKQLSGCPTHYVNNRTVPCDRDKCEACANGVPWRWHAYLLVQIVATQETVIFECTAISSASFTHYFERFGTLRGCHFMAQRSNNKNNGRVLIQTKPGDLSRIELPDDQDVRKLLCHIWNISENQIDETPRTSRPPARDITVDHTLPEIEPRPPILTEDDRAFVHQHARPRNGNGESHDAGTGV